MHNQFCREPDAGKPHVRIYAGVRPVRGVSTHQVQHIFSVWEVLVNNMKNTVGETAFGKAAGSAINKVGSSAGKVLNKASEKISNIKVGRQTLGEVANKTVKSSVDEFLDDPSGGRDSGTMSFLSDIASKIGGGNKR